VKPWLHWFHGVWNQFLDRTWRWLIPRVLRVRRGGGSRSRRRTRLGCSRTWPCRGASCRWIGSWWFSRVAGWLILWSCGVFSWSVALVFPFYEVMMTYRKPNTDAENSIAEFWWRVIRRGNKRAPSEPSPPNKDPTHCWNRKKNAKKNAKTNQYVTWSKVVASRLPPHPAAVAVAATGGS